MVGLAGWLRGWCTRGRGDRSTRDERTPSPCIGAAAAMAAAVADEEPPGTIPDLEVELSINPTHSQVFGEHGRGEKLC